MGTDRSREYSGPCPCGKGMLEIDDCTKDHGFADPDQHWYDKRVSCPVCSEMYELRKVGRQFGLFDKALAARNEKRRQDAWAAKQAIMEGERAQTLLDEFAAHLDHLPSVAARHRLLVDALLEHVSIGTFRKHWRSGKEWVQNSAITGSERVGKVLRVLGRTDAELVAQLKRAEVVEGEPEDMIGDPVHTLPRE